MAGIHFGFVNTPYTQETMLAPMRAAMTEAGRSRRRGFRTTKTAEIIANILEMKYGIVNSFYKANEKKINKIVGEKLLAEIEIEDEEGEIRFGRREKTVRGTVGKMEEVEKLFRTFLDREEMRKYSAGVPTKAARDRGGISFIRTGVYRASFRAWVD